MATPMIDDVELKAVQQIRQETDHGFVRQRIAGLQGTLHQKLGRCSHRVLLSGFLLPATATDDLKKLQQKAASGAEVTFVADITTALGVEKMVIESFTAEQQVGPTGQVAYALVLAESPPLPPPAEVTSFGGLGELGLSDLGIEGFDPAALGDVLGDIADQAGAVMDAVDTALAAVEQLQALASLGDLANVGNPIRPIADKVGELSELGPAVAALAKAVKDLTG
jgi:phage protein U